MLDATTGQQAHKDRTGDGAETPHNVQYGDEACACGGNGSAGDDVARGKACSEPEANAEERDVSRVKADPGHGNASGCGNGGTIEDAGAEIARGEPRSAELAGEAGGEEGACLGVLNVPALDECGQKRAEHNRGDAGCKKVEIDGNERAERLRGTGAGVGGIWGGELQSGPLSVCLAR